MLEALPEEFNSIVASVNAKSEVISHDELESQLLTQESRNEKFKKVVITKPVSVNLTKKSAREPNFGGRGQFRDRGGRSGGRFRGCGSVLVVILVVDHMFNAKYVLSLDMMQVTAIFTSPLLNLIITVLMVCKVVMVMVVLQAMVLLPMCGCRICLMLSHLDSLGHLLKLVVRKDTLLKLS